MTVTPGQEDLNRGRLRWQCRRALLELDIVFTRFLAKDFDSLDTQGLAALAELLAYEDHDLWQVVSGRTACEQAHLRGMVELLRAS